MSYVLTFVSSSDTLPLKEEHLADVGTLLRAHKNYPSAAPVWLCKGKAVDFGVVHCPDRDLLAALRHLMDAHKIDVFTSPVEKRRKKLLIADMDSTIVQGETLDDLAAHAGLKDQIAAITARAMNGELDFHAAIRSRVGLLRDLPVKALHDTLDKLVLNDGAEAMVKTMACHDSICVLVSGGFTFFTRAVANMVGFHAHHGNVLEIERDVLTGKVQEPILDKFSKVEFLKYYMNEVGIRADECMTIGDGANDIPMLQAAGLGVGYRPKPAVETAVDNVIIHGDLTAALYAQGYTEQNIQHAMSVKSAS